jgi:histone-lysine N-methyltransferase SETMAR
MYQQVEFRSVIRFLLLRGTEKKDIVIQLHQAYGSEAPCKATIYNWIREFSSGRNNVSDDERSGRPQEISDEKYENLKAIVKGERRITQRELSSRLNVSKKTVQNMLEALGIRKLCSRFVPRFLTAEMRQKRMQACEENLELFHTLGDRFLDNIVTEDETPLSLYVPYSKRESREWVFAEEKPPKMLRSGQNHRKCLMLSVFWDAKGIVKVDFTAQNINADYYCALLSDARKLRRKPRNQDLYLLHDNAPVHTAHKTVTTVAEKGFVLLSQPPYSPDLAPSDFWLFNHLKKHLRGQRIENKEDLRRLVQDFFQEKDGTFFKNGLISMVNRWRKCVEVEGDYVEK